MAEEKQFENKIKDYLKTKNAYFVKYFANRMTKSGIPDILASVNGYFVAIEVKAENGKPSELQKWNVQEIQKSGGFAIILRPSNFGMFKLMIDAICDDCPSTARQRQFIINEKFF